MQEALFTIELKGYSYGFVFGNVVYVDMDDTSNYMKNYIKNRFRKTRIPLQDGCINKPFSYKVL